ncbi:MAG: hypothetical protein AB7P35_17870 [Hyphomonadaceae bacterium]
MTYAEAHEYYGRQLENGYLTHAEFKAILRDLRRAYAEAKLAGKRPSPRAFERARIKRQLERSLP